MEFPDYGSNVPNLSSQAWVSNSDFRYGGFSGLHDAADDCLRGIFPDYEYFNGFTLNPNDLLDIDGDNVDINEIMNGNIGPLAFGVVGLLLALTLILLGICWCIFNGVMCCKGGKRKVESLEYVQNRFGQSTRTPATVSRKKKNKKLKIGLGVVLFCWMVLFLTFLIGLFITNEQLDNSIGGLTKEIDGYLSDADLYINVTKFQFEAVMIKSYDDLSVIIKEEGQCATNRIEKESSRDDGGWSFEESKRILSTLDTSVTQIIHDLRQQSNLQVPPLLKVIKSKTRDIEKSIQNFERSSNPSTRDVCTAVETVRQNLEQSAVAIATALDSVPIRQSREDLAGVEEVFQFAKNAIFYSVTALNVFLLVILVLISFGAILLVLPMRATIASFSINCALFTIFLTGWIIWIFALALFFLSGSLTIIVPGAFNNIAENGSLVNDYYYLNQRADYILPTAPHILTTCKDHESAYNVFKLEQVYNVSQLDNIVDIFFPPVTNFLSEALIGVENMKLELKNSETNSDIGKEARERVSWLVRELDNLLKGQMDRSRSRSGVEQKDDAEIRRQLDNYVDFAKGQIESAVGSCEPLWEVLESTLHTFSYKLGSPMSGYWFALNFIAILFFPMTITAFFLLRLF